MLARTLVERRHLIARGHGVDLGRPIAIQEQRAVGAQRSHIAIVLAEVAHRQAHDALPGAQVDDVGTLIRVVGERCISAIGGQGDEVPGRLRQQRPIAGRQVDRLEGRDEVVGEAVGGQFWFVRHGPQQPDVRQQPRRGPRRRARCRRARSAGQSRHRRSADRACRLAVRRPSHRHLAPRPSPPPPVLRQC